MLYVNCISIKLEQKATFWTVDILLIQIPINKSPWKDVKNHVSDKGKKKSHLEILYEMYYSRILFNLP